MSKSASIRVTASSATGEISWAGMPPSDLARDVGQLEELAPRMGPAQRAGDRPRLAVRAVEVVVAAVGIGLEDALPAGEVPVRVLHSCDRGEKWKIAAGGDRSAEGAVVAHIGPEPAGAGAALGQDRHGGVVAVQPLGRQDMRPDQRMERRQGRRAGADLVGQGGEAQVDALPGVALGLPVQRLVLPELLEQDHGQEVRPRPAPGRGMEGRRRLADALAVPAGELLAHRLDRPSIGAGSPPASR